MRISSPSLAILMASLMVFTSQLWQTTICLAETAKAMKMKKKNNQILYFIICRKVSVLIVPK